MKKIRKMLGLFLSLAMIVSIFSGTGLQIQAAATPNATSIADEDNSTITLYYDNSETNWSNVYAYVWTEGDSSVAPVVLSRTGVSGSIYTFQVASTYKNILFKNTDGTTNWDQQTADAEIPSESGYTFVTDSGNNRTSGHWEGSVEPTPTPPAGTVTFYYDNSKTNWNSVYVYAWGGDTTKTVKGTSVATNVYSFTISSNYQNVLFKNTEGINSWDQQTSDAGAPQSGKIFTPASSANRTSGTWNTYVPVSYKTVSYDNSKTNWSNVYAYVWVEGDSSVTPVVLAATSASGNIYSFRVASTYQNILFKNTDGTTSWNQQTADTTIPATDGYTFITYSGANKTSGYWSYSTVTVKRRALSYGVSDQDGTSLRHYNDAVSSAQMYEHFTYDGKAMERVECATNLTIAQFKQKVKTTFADTTEDDISYLSIACHGNSDGSICLGTNWTSMTGADFRALLDQCIKGEVVILLDCCYSGQAIGNGADAGEFSAEAFLEEFLGNSSNSGELAAERFHVICASSKEENSWGYNDYEIAVQIWEEGLGWLEQSSVSTDLKADANEDKKVTLAELYEYSYPLVLQAQPIQHVVVYPQNDDFVVGGRY